MSTCTGSRPVDALREQDFVAAKRLIATVAPASEEDEDAKLFGTVAPGPRDRSARRGSVTRFSTESSGRSENMPETGLGPSG